MLQHFQKLNKQDKIDFFLKCQDLLIKNHPDSPFVFNRANFKGRLQYAGDIFHKYNGMCYTDENVAILFNYLLISDPKDPISALKQHQFKSPDPQYNAISIDFVVFKELKDCLKFCRLNYNFNVEYVVWVKDGKPKIHRTLDFMTRILNIPIV